MSRKFSRMMFAAVNGRRVECLNLTAAKVREEMGGYYQEHPFLNEHREGWKLARKDGWSVKPVVVKVMG